MVKKKIVKIKPIMAVICDDIRQEDNGKSIIIGLHHGTINVSIPFKAEEENNGMPLLLSLWLPFEISSPGEAAIEIKIVSPNPKHQLKMNVQASFDTVPPEHQMSSFNFVRFPVWVENGHLEIYYRNKGENKWILLKKVPVVIHAVNSLK